MESQNEALLELANLQKQQAEDLQNLEVFVASLKQQQQKWQKSMDVLLETSHGPNTVQKPRMEVHKPLPRMEMHGGDIHENHEMDVSVSSSPEPEDDAPQRSLSRHGTLEELFRSKKSVVQSTTEYTGLKKLVEEEIRDKMRLSEQETTDKKKLQTRAKRIVDSSWFEYLSGFVILGNLVSIGIEAELSLQNNGLELGTDSPTYTLERIFLFIYCVEAGLRLLANGWASFRDAWFVMDILLVAIGLFALLLVPNIGASESMEGVEKLLIVRGLRLLRLVRALRMVNHFKIMWRLVYGLLTAAETIIAVSALITVFLFVFACVAVEVIAKDEWLRSHDKTGPVIREFFGSLWQTVMTLLQFVTMDSLASIYYPFILEQPWLLLFFMPMLIFISIGLMNLITAALVENAMQHAAQQAEEEKVLLKSKVRGAMPSLLKIFDEIDKDESGMITRDELHHVPLDILPDKILASVCVDNWEELFEYLDVDGTHSLSQVEFVEGLLNLCLMDMPIATVQTLKLLHLIRSTTRNLESDLAYLKKQLSRPLTCDK